MRLTAEFTRRSSKGDVQPFANPCGDATPFASSLETPNCMKAKQVAAVPNSRPKGSPLGKIVA